MGHRAVAWVVSNRQRRACTCSCFRNFHADYTHCAVPAVIWLLCCLHHHTTTTQHNNKRKQQAGLSGLSFDEGTFGVFGYVTSGMDNVSKLQTGDVIRSAKLVAGRDRLVLPQQQ